MRPLNDQAIIVQVLISLFLYIDLLMIVTFFKKEAFHSVTRYIFFAHTLICDCTFLVISDVLLLLSYLRIIMPTSLCMLICAVVVNLNVATPLTLTAMSVERYVSICMPLRHAELSTPQRAAHAILVVQAMASVLMLVTMISLAVVMPLDFYLSRRVCSLEMLQTHAWQKNLTNAVSQFYFLLMSLAICFCYVKIMGVARVASGADRSSMNKGLRTVVLHALQLLLSLIQLWCPFVELAVLQIDLHMFVNLRYFDYVMFILAPRCLVPLVYGLRDESFLAALKHYAFFGCYNKITPVTKDKKNHRKASQRLQT
ncbi:odorant receptor 131-2-like [Alosa sapidissima]|uniref:odorant receptor 131-2-like n=1 Tax=Alosa sapidissima TaxID=34773 RepID=UPI001C0A5AE1|nr:odorant receptor 131-2-like [Alosa sapidissima]